MDNKKTAEEVLRKIGNGVISKSVALSAMEEYASTVAKEAVEEHKAKLRNEFDDAGGTVSGYYLQKKGLI